MWQAVKNGTMRSIMTIEFDEEKQKTQLDSLHKEEEEEFVEMNAKNKGLGYVNLSKNPIDTDALRLISEEKTRESLAVPFSLINKNVSVAAVSLEEEHTKKIVAGLRSRGFEVQTFLASHASINRAVEKYKELSFAFETKAGALDISNEEIGNLVKEVKTSSDIKSKIEAVLKQKKSYRITRIVEIIIAGALSLNASDIHIEPEESYVRLRYRLDGVLNSILDFDKDTFGLILSRVKLLSGLKLNVKTEAQDGRFSVKVYEDDIEIRTSILPGAYNESIVLRLLNPKSIVIDAEELGINKKLLAIILHEIAKPTGMILTTGPTGSGKTTTLYAFLRKIHKPEVKIITIENPIEYHLPGIVQTQTDPEKNYTFELGLRSALRQDPDVLMVGEIRDSETAEIAVNAALTGHLVFSTLHTNNAAGSFPRLIDLGVNPKIISSALNVSMAQRLVRKLCHDCKKAHSPTEKEKTTLKKIIDQISDKMERVPMGNIFEASGCSKCNHTGYRGRIGVFEAILMDKNIERVINENPSEREIKQVAKNQEILDMREDGVIKVLQGITSLQELTRVVDLESNLS